MQWIICYDIQNNKARSKVCNILRRYSGSYQKSGFEVLVFNQTHLQPLLNVIAPHISETDRFLFVKHPNNGPDWHIGQHQHKQYNHLLVWS